MVWWSIIISLMCLLRGSLTNNEGKFSEKKYSSTNNQSVPGLTAVYTIRRRFPGPNAIACLNEGSDKTLTHIVPSHLHTPTFKDNSWSQEIQWDIHSHEVARGAVCLAESAPLYPISFPLMTWRASLVPEYLSYTISSGEDLYARFRGAVPRGQVWWQKEPIKTDKWNHATFNDDGAIVVPYDKLTGSGFYSFIKEIKVNNTRISGTLSLVIRECPAHRYGIDCQNWCPDCMHGGMCHPRTGKCVCHEGLMGERCEIRCERGISGRHCTLTSINVPGSQFCQPSPTPCRCVPGYTGSRCTIACAKGRWGSNCEQICNHHCAGNCDSENGDCDAEGPSLCSGGDAGLPRLREAPRVTEIRAEEATIKFSPWRNGYDDGEADLWDNLTYVIRLKVSSSEEFTDIITSSFHHTLNTLAPNTKYELMVLVRVYKDQNLLTCMADGRGRERIHSVYFTTTCPEDIPMPVIIHTEKLSDRSVFVKWKPVSLPPGCSVEYHLSATPDPLTRTPVPLDILNITLTEVHGVLEGLKAGVAYTISVFAKSTTSSAVSPPYSTLLKIHENAGHTQTAAVVTAVMVVTAVVIVVLMWRRKRPSSSTQRRVHDEETKGDKIATDIAI